MSGPKFIAKAGDSQGEAERLESPKDGDGHSELAELARQHHRSLLRFLTARTGSQDEAREVAQEAYAKMLALDRPQTIGFLAGYLWKLARNIAIDRERQRNTRARLDQDVLSRTDRHAPSAETVVDVRQRLELLEKALDQLPPRCLEAFILRKFEELSFRDVAQRMNCSERMAMMYVARALEYCQHSIDSAEAARRMPK
jgi:RNA polymerase sigma factor (sigma-70 family)